MSIKVNVPSPLQKLTGGLPEIKSEGKNIRELLDNLEKNYPGIKGRLCDSDGKIRRFINFYVNGQDIRFLKNDLTEINDGDEVSIIPAIAGG